MKTEIDPEHDIAYVSFLKRPVRDGEVARTVPVPLPGQMLNLDFDADGHFIGFEVSPCTVLLAPDLMDF